MKTATFAWLIAAMLLAGCQTPKHEYSRPPETQDEIDGLPAPVVVKGNVRRPVIPWSEELTVARAIVAADYVGLRDPVAISIRRNGEQLYVHKHYLLLAIVDPYLEPGDIVELHTATPIKPAVDISFFRRVEAESEPVTSGEPPR